MKISGLRGALFMQGTSKLLWQDTDKTLNHNSGFGMNDNSSLFWSNF